VTGGLARLLAASAILASSAFAVAAARDKSAATRPSTRPAAAPTSRPAASDAAATVAEFFDALRKRDLAGAKKLCWAPPGEFDGAFAREWPSESKKMASGKRVVAVIDGKEAADLAIVMFNEDVADANNVGSHLEPLWLVKRDGAWRLLISVNANALASLPANERSQARELRTWFSERKRQLADEAKAKAPGGR
jgi:hypothetical protein